MLNYMANNDFGWHFMNNLYIKIKLQKKITL